jgi:LPS-assembly protein
MHKLLGFCFSRRDSNVHQWRTDQWRTRDTQLTSIGGFHRSLASKLAVVASFVALSLLSGYAYAQEQSSDASVDDEGACGAKPCVCRPSQISFQSNPTKPGPNGKYPIALEANDVQADGDDKIRLKGDAMIAQGRQTVVADQIEYSRSTDRLLADGNVEVITGNGDYFSAGSVDVFAQTQIGQLNEVDYKLAKSMTSANGVDTVNIAARGTAGTVNLEGEGFTRLEDVAYTTCPEGQDHVMINAGQLELDQIEAVGVARNAVVRFMGVPLFYTPYISFPLNDERKTGLLTPGFGNDEESGNIIEIPWYWNIAPNQDATITPRIYTDRGVQLGVQYRHKSENSDTSVYGEYLPSDDLFGDDRDMFSLRHSNRFTDDWSLNINYNDVSDSRYFEDFRNGEVYFSASYVESNSALSYSGEYLSASLSTQDYKIVDSDISEQNTPYEKTRLYFKTRLPDGPAGLEYGVVGEISNWSQDFIVEGTRTALSPYLELPLKNVWGFVTPRLDYHFRDYSLDRVAAGANENPSFEVPVFSLDTGIFLEKTINWFGASALQTLEPRIFYAYAPSEEDQLEAPRFDTGTRSQSGLSSIFRANRFSGWDRVGDTNQVTFGVTSRIIDNETGDERLKIEVGQFYLLEDQEIGLTASETGIESGAGDLLMNIIAGSEDDWSSSLFVQYDHDESEVRRATARYGYSPSEYPRKSIDLTYSYANSLTGDDTRQIALSGKWPLSDRWSIFGNTRYSIEDSESLNSSVGFEFNNCCWAARLVVSDRLTNNDINDRKQAVFFQLELTGLGKISSDLFSSDD